MSPKVMASYLYVPLAMASVYFGVIFILFCFLNWLFAAIFSNCSNSLNFEAKINCNIFKPNVPKWRKTCTGLNFDLLHFYGPQSHILLGDTFEGPCTRALSLLKASPSSAFAHENLLRNKPLC